MAEKIIYAYFDDDEVLLKGSEELVSKGVHIKDAFTPFPVHGLDEVLHVRQTRLAICAFLFGLTGLSLAFLGIWYFMIYDWPMNIGGKPSFSFVENMPSFIPASFEFTVLCAAHGMAITFLLRSKYLPGLSPRNPDPRTSDDTFALKVLVSENPEMGEEELKESLKGSGAFELDERNV
ncbi:MAG: DUF3341 domain-containing protein [Flavobacteriales bacterium]